MPNVGGVLINSLLYSGMPALPNILETSRPLLLVQWGRGSLELSSSNYVALRVCKEFGNTIVWKKTNASYKLMTDAT